MRLTAVSCFRCSISIKLPCTADRRVGSAAILPGPDPDSPKQAASVRSSSECGTCLRAAAGWLRAPRTEVGSKPCLKARDSRYLAENKIAGRSRGLLRGTHLTSDAKKQPRVKHSSLGVGTAMVPVPVAAKFSFFRVQFGERWSTVPNSNRQAERPGPRRRIAKQRVSCHSFLASWLHVGANHRPSGGRPGVGIPGCDCHEMLCDTRESGAFSLFLCWSDWTFAPSGARGLKLHRSGSTTTMQRRGGPETRSTHWQVAHLSTVPVSKPRGSDLGALRHPETLPANLGRYRQWDSFRSRAASKHSSQFPIASWRPNRRLVYRRGRREALFVSGPVTQGKCTTGLPPGAPVQVNNKRFNA